MPEGLCLEVLGNSFAAVRLAEQVAGRGTSYATFRDRKSFAWSFSDNKGTHPSPFPDQ
jgi:hypothetical protein